MGRNRPCLLLVQMDKLIGPSLSWFKQEIFYVPQTRCNLSSGYKSITAFTIVYHGTNVQTDLALSQLV